MATDQTPRPRVVHQWPPAGSGPTGTTPCCGMQPVDLPVADRMANNVGEVTCEALAARARAFAVVPTASDSNSEGLIGTEIGRVSLALRRAAGAVVPDPDPTTTED